jgi:O-antigen ligase
LKLLVQPLDEIMTTATPAPTNRISSYILFGTVVAVPFPFGSTDPAAIAFWCIVLGLGAIFVSPRRLRREHFPLVGLALIVTLAYAFVLHEQLAARPWIASPHPLWRESAKTLGILIEPSASIARNQPFLVLGAPLANILALICSFIVCIDRARARQLLHVIAWSGVAYAAYGIAAYKIDPTHVLWREAPQLHTLSSTFSYRSTAAVYFGSCAVLWLLFSLEHLRRRLPPDSVYWRSAPHLLLSEMPILSIVMFFICLTALLMTESKAGTMLSFMALVLAIVAFFYRDLRRRRWILVALMIGGLTAFALLETLGANVVHQLEAAEFGLDQGRLDTYRSMLRIIADHSWFGTGLGTFVWSFPAYRSGDMWGIWTFAHSTPLELAGDLGLPLTGLIGLAWLVVLGVLMRGVGTRRKDRIIPAGALAVAILSLTHSFIDFSFQIPGYAIVVFALVGAGLAQSFSSNNKTLISPAQSLAFPEAKPQSTRTVTV